MKSVCLIALIIVTAYVVHAATFCDIDSAGKPECLETNVKHTFRNFWDPAHYWYCANANEEPQLLRCPPGTLFDESTNECISWRHWEWINPCPENDE